MTDFDAFDPEAVGEAVRKLQAMGLQELRAAWTARYGCAPKLRSADLLRRLLAWRVQAQAFGGFDPETMKRLRAKGGTRAAGPRSGTKLAREWEGVRHEVEVLDRGVVYRGEVYASLSEVARLITGVRWNGPRFFGLRSGS